MADCVRARALKQRLAEFISRQIAMPGQHFADNYGVPVGVPARGDHLDPVAGRQNNRLIDPALTKLIEKFRHRVVFDEEPVAQRQTAGAMIDADDKGSAGRV